MAVPTTSSALLSPLFLLLLLTTPLAAKTTISFYEKASCGSDSPRSGDSFETDSLAVSSGLCYRPPEGTSAMKIEEIDDGCSITSYLDSTCSMPTSSVLDRSTPPCYFLGPSDLLGSFKATCSGGTSASSAGADASASPGLQGPPAENAAAVARADWVEICARALMAVGAVEVIAWA